MKRENYNHRVAPSLSSIRIRSSIRIQSLAGTVIGYLIAALLLAGPLGTARAADSQDTGSAASPSTSHGAMAQEKLLLVLPFEQASDKANLAQSALSKSNLSNLSSNLSWIGEAVPEILNRRLASAGFMPIDREDRLYALEHLGLPQSFQPSRASAIRLAQNLDADYLVVGSFANIGSRLTVTARILDMHSLHLSPPVEESAGMPELLSILDNLAWDVAKEIDPRFAVAKDTFAAADRSIRLDAFEHYVRGLMETDASAQIQHLKTAVQLDPSYSPALFALGMSYFDNQQYDLAASTLGRLQRGDPNARQADFYRGLAYLYTGNYADAENAFAFVSHQLPLPEVVNDEAVAASRRGHDGSPLFLEAVQADPSDPDYQFNLAVSLARKNDLTGATTALNKALKLRPEDTEAQSFATELQAGIRRASGTPGGGAGPSGDASSLPLERVKRSFNEASFRQAALEMEQMEAMRLSSLPPAARAVKLTEAGTHFLNQGLNLEAEREFQAALQVDSSEAQAHAGLAIVRERNGDAEGARREATESLALHPTFDAYLVLTRLDIASNRLPEAAQNLGQALELEPKDSIALGLRQQLESKGQQIP